MTKEEKINTLKAIIQECKEYQWQRKETLFEIIKNLEQESYEDWYDIPSDEMTLEQAGQAVKEYEENLKQTNDVIKIGDEIYSELTNTKAVIFHIDAWHRYECFVDSGSFMSLDEHTFSKYWAKTGKNYPQIAEVLKQLKEKNNE